ncbi:MAG: hypothetical protein GWN79_25945, partial [Actinobacteria bacterium]|nr:hypothetical protein [Actinomycetota bacterium]NIT98663.1 hypothetical protein [Actinomycetota bacterium]NIU22279.1 hypothetical protein [Actinomycetota bacterium]NIV58846.1 hypothetical protein [Actinomycetota bacterium]NIV90426.1 hypothetical protein [Actinomycetota bacterium]
MNRPIHALAAGFAALVLLFAWPGSAGARPGVSSTPDHHVVDLADVPLNRASPLDRYEARREQFFPSLLGLRSPGAQAIRTRHFYI